MIRPITYIDPETTSLNDFIKESVFNVDMKKFKDDSMFYNKIGNYAFAKNGLNKCIGANTFNEGTIGIKWLEMTVTNKRYLGIIENALTLEFTRLFKRIAPKKKLQARYRGKTLIKLVNGK